MGLIQEGDFSISYNSYDDAIVYHFPTKTTYIGCGTNDRSYNLKKALDTMERILKERKDG